MTNPRITLPVEHVSDTAYMVAMCRAYESERPDAKFNDPYARLLAAPKAELFERFPHFREEGTWLLTVRTCLLDEHVRELVASGVDTVVNLAAGLDTRPYRLDLPKALHWIEADFPGVIDYKTDRLAQESPRCRLERIALDLRDDSARAELFSRVDREATRALVITEGLLPYLDEQAVSRLATDLRKTRSVNDWAMDFTNGGFLQRLKDRWQSDAQSSNVVLEFAPTEGLAFFAPLGWKVLCFESFLEAGEKLGRRAPAALAGDAGAATAADEAGVAVLTRA